MTWLYLNDTVLQKRNTFFVINSTAEIRQDTLSYTLTFKLTAIRNVAVTNPIWLIILR